MEARTDGQRPIPLFAFGNVAVGWIAVGNVAIGFVAIGFSVAIGPIAYNKITNDMGRYANRLEGFADEFNTILSRQLEEGQH